MAAFVQSATGFGFALVLSPVLLFQLEPKEAVFALLFLGTAVNLLVLLGERRPTQVLGREVGLMLTAAVPGAAVGLVILAALDKATLQVIVGVLVIGAAALQVVLERRPRGGPAGPAWTAYPAGLASGVLTTSTSLSGPPLVLWLLGRHASPGEIRDSLAASFLALNAVGIAALLLAGGVEEGLDPAFLLALVPPTALGQVVGRRAFDRLNQQAFRVAAMALVVAAGLASVVGGLGAV